MGLAVACVTYSSDEFATGVNIRTSGLALWGNDKKSPVAMMPTGPDAVALKRGIKPVSLLLLL
jgi:hypothetical protein